MPAAPLPTDEMDRLRSLWACNVLDTPPDPRFDCMTNLAARLYNVPIALVSLIDEDRQWFKSAVGLNAGDETPREYAMCAYALLRPTQPLVVEDATLDDRFSDNPYVTKPGGVRFYAGVPLLDNHGRALGTLCIVDTKPRHIAAHELETLIALAAGVTSVLELHRNMAELQRSEAQAKYHAEELEVAREKAETADRAKSMFLAAMSHEIRTPMTGVLGMADLLSEEPLNPKQLNYVNAIRTSGRHLLTVINDILDFSRSEAGGLTLEEIDFSVGEVLEEVQSIMSPQAVERGLTLAFDLDEHSPPVVRGDPTRLRQILVNLVGNGLKFTSKGGVLVTIRCRSLCDGRVQFCFAVRDTGIGIPKEHHSALFEAFTQADLSTTRRFGGSGLGLAICRQLVGAMGGTIGVDSAPGQGSTFRFDVPLIVGDVVVVREKAALDPADTLPLRVLVVEDVDVNRDLLHAILTRQGHEVTLACNGAEAVEVIARQAFDVILMDVQMPIMDGIEATRRIRAMPPPKGTVPILALTANVMESEKQRCLAAGMSRVLTKPITWQDLFVALAKIGPAPGHDLEPSTQVVPATDELLDHDRLEGLRKMAGDAKCAAFLNNAMTSTVMLYAEILDTQADPSVVAAAAHRLAGTSPSFGLVRVGAIARRLEEQAGHGPPYADLVDGLGMAIRDTRKEMERLGLLVSSSAGPGGASS